jgi:hypothetical protein
MLALKIPSPLGFLALERLTANGSSDPEWPLQIVPAVCGLLAIPLFYLTLRKLVTDRWVLGLACLVAACHPVAELYSMRIKHYSLDMLVAIGLLWLMLESLRRPSLARFGLLVLASSVAALFSFASLFVSLCFVHALVIDRAWRGHTARRFDWTIWVYVAGAVGFDLAIAVLHHELLADQSSPTMKAFWRNYFLHFDTAGSALLWFGRRFLAFPMQALSAPLLVLAPFLFSGGRALARDLQLRPLTWACAALVLGLVAAAALDIYPMGAERTGLFSYPLFWAVAAVGGERWLNGQQPASRARRRVSVALAAYVAIVCLARPAVSYSDVRDRQVIEEALRLRKPGDGLMMQHTGLLAFAYYSNRPLRFEAFDDVCHRYAAWPDFPELNVLPIEVGGVMLRDDPQLADAQLAEIFARRYRNIYYVSTHANEAIDRHIVERAEQHGYASRRNDASPQARLFIFEPMQPRSAAPSVDLSENGTKP